jgi:hypothetical protein
MNHYDGDIKFKIVQKKSNGELKIFFEQCGAEIEKYGQNFILHGNQVS